MDKLIDDYISENDKKYFCSDCYELCGYQCPVWRKAKTERDKSSETEGDKMEQFDFKKFTEKSIINQFRRLCSDTNSEKVFFVGTGYSVQKFYIEYAQCGTTYRYDGIIQLENGFIEFNPKSKKEI